MSKRDMKSNIAATINATHGAVEAAKREGTRHAIECGRLLIEAKETVPHGGWDSWVRDHCRFSGRTAQLYMKLHRYAGGDPAKAQRVADLSLREAANLVSESERPRSTRSLPDPEFLSWIDDLTEAWLRLSPAGRIEAADRLLAAGSMTVQEHAAFVRAARTRSNDDLFVQWMEDCTSRSSIEKAAVFIEIGGDIKRVAKRIRRSVDA